jgi:hypothetical protein
MAFNEKLFHHIGKLLDDEMDSSEDGFETNVKIVGLILGGYMSTMNIAERRNVIDNLVRISNDPAVIAEATRKYRHNA